MELAQTLAGKKILIGVMTCPKFSVRANSIRATWLKNLPANLSTLFVFGDDGPTTRLEGNKLTVNCKEAYENLPEKVYRFFKFCHQELEFDYILKVDDDSYVDFNRLLSFDLREADYIGYFQGMGDEQITRTWHYGKCSDKSLEVPYEGAYIADWARGGGYILSRKAVDSLVRTAAGSYKAHIFEDKMVGDALASDSTIINLHAECVEFGVVNPLHPHNMVYEHQLNLALKRAKESISNVSANEKS